MRQKSVLDGFTFEFVDDTCAITLGGFSYAWFAQAKNARLRMYSDKDAVKGDIQMTFNGHPWRVRALYLSRGHLSDLRYTLETGAKTIHAQVDVWQKLRATVAQRGDDSAHRS